MSNKLFKVPETQDMIQNLFCAFPPSAKTHDYFELVILGVIAFQTLGFLFFAAISVGVRGVLELPFWYKVYSLLVFVIFRASYNAGLGISLLLLVFYSKAAC